MKHWTIAFAAACIVGSVARADIDTWNVDVLGNTVPSITNIPGLPGYSGYTVSLRAKNPNHMISAVDLGTNPANWPLAGKNFGLFGPMHQRWITDEGESIPTPEHNNNVVDSHFLFDYNVNVMVPWENNNVSASPLPDTTVADYGTGDLMRAIVGTANMNLHEMPLVYLVIPDGQLVQMKGEVATNNLHSREAPNSSVVAFSIGHVPEPMGLLPASGVLSLVIRRRRPR